MFHFISGRWVFELMLGSKGVMQVGWATLGCRFSQEVKAFQFEQDFPIWPHFLLIHRDCSTVYTPALSLVEFARVQEASW